MGLYDRLKFSSNYDFPSFTNSVEVSDIVWQTKELDRKLFDYKVGKSGQLYVREVERREMTKKEKDEYAQSKGYDSWESWDNNEKAYPLSSWSKKISKEKWIKKDFTRSFEIHTIIEDDYWSYTIEFDSGELKNIEFNERR